MTPPPFATRASTPPAARRGGAGLDALVMVLAGAGLLAFGVQDARLYLASVNRPTATFRLANIPGDTRVREEEFFHTGGTAVRLSNTAEVERTDDRTYRHAFGPVDTVEIRSEQPSARLGFLLEVATDNQDITVAFDGQTLEQVHMGRGVLARSYPLTLHPGANDFTFSFSAYNHHGIEFESKESRPIAATFYALDLTLP